MCDHAPNREAAMPVIRPGVWCDPCIAPLVGALNDAGLQTIASCCGHGTHPTKVMLADKREVFLVDQETAEQIHAFLNLAGYAGAGPDCGYCDRAEPHYAACHSGPRDCGV